MELIVADSNIFVYFFRVNLLEKILTHKNLTLKITVEVFKELTVGMRIPREYPELSQFINNAINNSKMAYNLSKIDINSEISNLHAMEIYYELDAQGLLDAGEIESIPLAFHLGAIFISNDTDAVTVANEIGQRFNRVIACSFMDFCDQLLGEYIINPQELISIKELFKLSTCES